MNGLGDRFYVWWLPCWGGGRVWTICESRLHKDGGDRRVRPREGEPAMSERRARSLCAQMNAAYERYQQAMWRKVAC